QRPDLIDAGIGFEFDRGSRPVTQNQVSLDPQLPENFQQTDTDGGAGRSSHRDYQAHGHSPYAVPFSALSNQASFSSSSVMPCSRSAVGGSAASTSSCTVRMVPTTA